MSQSRHLEPRALHLLDIENLVRGLVTFDRVAAAWSEYTDTVPVGDTDHVIVGFCPETAAIGAFALPPQVRKVIGRRGKDSADLALTDCLDLSFMIRRYTQVYIASADHHFAPLATTLVTHGLTVTQVLGASTRSVALGRVCPNHLRLPLGFDRVA